MNVNIDHQKIFETPLFEINIENIDNEELAKNIYKLKEHDKGEIKSNFGGWHSTCNPENIDICFKPFISKLGGILPKLPFNPSIKEVISIDIWANINPKGSYNTTHNHPGCDLSGVYYVKVPKGDCGNINFLDPRPALNFGNSFIVQRYVGGDSIPRYPVEGNMYLFPSSLSHDVSTNKIDEDRISISFNLNLR